MKITKLETFFVQPRWMFLKVSTDEGLVGWGEPIVEGRARTVAMAIKEFEPVLIGADPMRIEDLWQLMYRGTFYRGGPVLVSAISGIEQALWILRASATTCRFTRCSAAGCGIRSACIPTSTRRPR